MASRHRRAAWVVAAAFLLFPLVWFFSPQHGLQGAAHYASLHALLEVLSIVVAGLVFGIAWNAYSGERPGNIVILGCALLAAGILDLVHALSYPGMPELVTAAGTEKAIYFWLMGRYVVAFALLVTALRPWAPLRRPSGRLLLLATALGGTALATWFGLARLELFPRTFVPGEGLTVFKIGAEYLAMAAYAAAAILFLRSTFRDEGIDALYLSAAAGISVLSELCFTLYTDATDTFNLLGHLYKTLAYAFIYRAVFVGSVRAPFEGLHRAQQALSKSAAEITDLYHHAPCGYHSLDREGRIVRINDTELQWLGYARKEVLGRRFVEFLAPASVETFHRNYARFKEQGWVRDVEYDLVRQDGSLLPVLASATAIRDENGEYVASRATLFDITERRRMEEELRRHRDHLEEEVAARTGQLQAAYRELESFSYSVSHDLRAPLRAINGFSTLLMESEAERLRPEGRELMERVIRNSRRMGELIDDLLDYSRANQAVMSRREVDMAGLARAVGAELAEDYPAAGLAVGPLPGVLGDEALLREVWQNLIDNAFKYSAEHPEPRVEISAERVDGHEFFRVRDNGAGFDMAYADKLFGMFQRLHGDDRFPGTGVGLAIVKRIVERHGGCVGAEGRPGEGATFWFSLPAGDSSG